VRFTLRAYYQLTKPGIVYGNALTVIAGFFLASSFHSWRMAELGGVLVGTSLVIASACVINNVIDRRIDIHMERTKKRALVTGEITPPVAIIFGVILGAFGFGMLVLLTNRLTVVLGLIAYAFYVGLYGYSKRRSEHGTLIGSIPGALPPVAGYTAVTNHVDAGAVILFLMLVFWQMAHFYAIAIYRRDEYAAAGIPILSVTRGKRTVLVQAFLYTIGFLLVSLALSLAGFTGWVYALIMVVTGGWWVVQAGRALQTIPTKLDTAARKLFFASLAVNVVMCSMVALGGYLP